MLPMENWATVDAQPVTPKGGESLRRTESIFACSSSWGRPAAPDSSISARLAAASTASSRMMYGAMATRSTAMGIF